MSLPVLTIHGPGPPTPITKSTSRPEPEFGKPVSRKLRDQLKLDPAQFTALFEHELRPDSTRTGLMLLREKAHNEERLREAYQDRALYELLQNARDAGATRVACVLSPHGLAFLHDGRWFTVANLRSLVDGWSDKKPDECIGHKGLGFRSVLEITPSPHLIRVQHDDFFGVRFS
jgi:hypothetical protein